VATLCSTRFKIQIFYCTFDPHRSVMCFVWYSDKRAIGTPVNEIQLMLKGVVSNFYCAYYSDPMSHVP
jgi:hypothetical protein